MPPALISVAIVCCVMKNYQKKSVNIEYPLDMVVSLDELAEAEGWRFRLTCPHPTFYEMWRRRPTCAGVSRKRVEVGPQKGDVLFRKGEVDVPQQFAAFGVLPALPSQFFPWVDAAGRLVSGVCPPRSVARSARRRLSIATAGKATRGSPPPPSCGGAASMGIR